MKEKVFDIDNKQVGEASLDENVFDARVNKPLLYEIVKMQLANRRLGTAKAKNRGEVSGTTAKMYRQKGTGRARHGDERANIFVGGGKAFGPRPRDYSYRLPKSARRGGIISALSLKKKENKLIIVDAFSPPEIKTKGMVERLRKMGVASGLIVVDGRDVKLEKSVRNIPGVKLIRQEGLNAYDLLNHEHAVITLGALNKVQERLKP